MWSKLLRDFQEPHPTHVGDRGGGSARFYNAT